MKRQVRYKLIKKMRDEKLTTDIAAFRLFMQPKRLSEYRHGYRKKLRPWQIDILCDELECNIEDILYADDIRQYNSDKEKQK